MPSESDSVESVIGKRLDASGYDTDKAYYLPVYEEHLAPFAGRGIKLLELGIAKGGSLLLWRDYFPNGTIVGLDRERVQLEDPTGRIHVYQGAQEDTELLDRIAREIAPEGFDIIIDDCSHQGELTRISFWHLFEHHLKPGGLFAIEDWGTGYWDGWTDGARYRPSKPVKGESRFPSHDYGMVGFIKELIDECGMRDITRPGRGVAPSLVRSSRARRHRSA